MGPVNSKSKLIRKPKPGGIRVPSAAEKAKAEKTGKMINFILLGAGESGKTTILRQMRNLYGEGFTEEYKEFMKPFIFYNIIDGCVKVLRSLKAQQEELSPELEAALELLSQQKKPGTPIYEKGKRPSSLHLSKEVADAINLCLKNKEFVVEGESHSNYLIQDSWFELAGNVQRYPEDWGGPAWMPGSADILNCRVRTDGVVDTFFKVEPMIYRMVDVSGQKGQRKKYMSMFRNMQVVLFVQSLSEFNLNMFELPNEARFLDSLQFWKEVVTSNVFKTCIFVLFFNKKDIFIEKYYHEKKPLPTTYTNFRMPPKVEDEKDENCQLALDWYEDLYMSVLTPAQQQRIIVKVTTATNENVMREVTDSVSNFLVTEILRNNGLPA